MMEPKVPSPSPNWLAWVTLKAGLLTAQWGVLAYVAGVILLLVAGAKSALGIDLRELWASWPEPATAAAITLVAATGLAAAGIALCWAVPVRRRWLVPVAAACAMLAVVAGSVGASLPRRTPLVPLQFLLHAASAALYLAFLRELAIYLNREDLAVRARALVLMLSAVIIFVIATFGLMPLSVWAFSGPGVAAGAAAIVLILLALFLGLCVVAGVFQFLFRLARLLRDFARAVVRAPG